MGPPLTTTSSSTSAPIFSSDLIPAVGAAHVFVSVQMSPSEKREVCGWGLDTGRAVSRETGICLKTAYCSPLSSGGAANHCGAADLQGRCMSSLEQCLSVGKQCRAFTQALLQPVSFRFDQVLLKQTVIHFSVRDSDNPKQLHPLTGSCRGLCLCIFQLFLANASGINPELQVNVED